MSEATHVHHLVAEDRPGCHWQARFEKLGNDQVYLLILEESRPFEQGVATQEVARARYRRLLDQGWVPPGEVQPMIKHELFTMARRLQKV